MKKVLNTIKNVFVWVFVIFTLGMMVFTIVSVSTFDRNDRDLLGVHRPVRLHERHGF